MTGIVLLTSTLLNAQDTVIVAEKPKPVFSGSVDAYYRYNFHNADDGWNSNNYTSFTNSQNSFELGMASIKVDYSGAKFGGVIDLGFGRRATEFSYNDVTEGDDVAPTALAYIKQAYVSYSPTSSLKFTAGKWATHMGYELLDPQLNRNYSMSYLFSYGPFFHTGLKADVSFADHFGVMLGVANPTDYSTASYSNKFVLGQFSASYDKFKAYLNYVGGNDYDDAVNHQLGLTAIGTISDKFGVGLDLAKKWYKPSGDDTYSWAGGALYLNVDPCPTFGVTLRGEYFADEDAVAGFGTSIFDATLSLNIRPVDHIQIIPEFRIDSAKDEIFTKKNGDATKSTGTFTLAAIFSF